MKRLNRRTGRRLAPVTLLDDLVSARKLLLKARKECPKELVMPGYAFEGWYDAINALKVTIGFVKRRTSNGRDQRRDRKENG